MKAIEIDFVLLERRNRLMISTSASSTANGIGKSTIYTAIAVNTWVRKNHEVKVNV